MALPTAASAFTDDDADNKRSSYDPPTNSMRNALIRIRARTSMYHCLVKTRKPKKVDQLNSPREKASVDQWKLTIQA